MMWLRQALGYGEPERPRVSPIENNPVGWSSIYPPQVMTNPDPNVSPVVDRSTMTPQALWGALLSGNKRYVTAAELPALENKANTAVDYGMAVAGATQPIRAYHASPNMFDKFDLSKAGTTTDAGELGRALYFTTDGAIAVSPPFAGAGTKMPHRYEVAISAKNPMAMEFPNWNTDKAKLIREKLNLPRDASAEEVAAKVQALGHDAVMLDYSPVGYDAKEVAVFRDDIIDILRRYGLFGLGMMGAAGAKGGQEQ